MWASLTYLGGSTKSWRLAVVWWVNNTAAATQQINTRHITHSNTEAHNMHFAISQVAPYKDVIVVLESKNSKKKNKKKTHLCWEWVSTWVNKEAVAGCTGMIMDSFSANSVDIIGRHTEVSSTWVLVREPQHSAPYTLPPSSESTARSFPGKRNITCLSSSSCDDDGRRFII